MDEALTRDGVGRITTKTEQWLGVQESRSYAYDVSGRLVRVDAEGDVLRRYGWDANSNRHDLLADGTPDPAKAATYDAQDRVLTWGEWSFDYDAKGSTTARTNTTTGAVRRTTYDVFGNLQRVELEDGTEVSYRVDARNRRVARQVNGATTHGWAYGDQLEPVAEYDGAGNLVARYVYGSRGHVPDYVEKDGQTYAYVTDHLGSVRMVVNVSTGDVAQRLRYDEWGRVEEDTNPGFQPFGYAGGIQDALTGLVRFGARDYDPEIGRWTTKDPIQFDGGMNWYGYVGGDPVNWVDVTGLAPPWEQPDPATDPWGAAQHTALSGFTPYVLWNLGRSIRTGVPTLMAFASGAKRIGTGPNGEWILQGDTPFPGSAISFGQVILLDSHCNPDGRVGYEGDDVSIVNHELGNSRQEALLGPLYLPFAGWNYAQDYLLTAAYNAAFGTNHKWMDNTLIDTWASAWAPDGSLGEDGEWRQ